MCSVYPTPVDVRFVLDSGAGGLITASAQRKRTDAAVVVDVAGSPCVPGYWLRADPMSERVYGVTTGSPARLVRIRLPLWMHDAFVAASTSTEERQRSRNARVLDPNVLSAALRRWVEPIAALLDLDKVAKEEHEQEEKDRDGWCISLTQAMLEQLLLPLSSREDASWFVVVSGTCAMHSVALVRSAPTGAEVEAVVRRPGGHLRSARPEARFGGRAVAEVLEDAWVGSAQLACDVGELMMAHGSRIGGARMDLDCHSCLSPIVMGSNPYVCGACLNHVRCGRCGPAGRDDRHMSFCMSDSFVLAVPLPCGMV